MKITLSVIKADIGSIGGHLCPSQRLLETVNEQE
jgi:fructose 1,6-bisphosphate aldolase/phosphatase